MSFKAFVEETLTRRPGQKFSFVLAFLALGLYIQLGYFTSRTDTALLISTFTILFVIYLFMAKSVISFRILLIFGILYRLILVFSIPTLSDDFYRFFWDGVLIVNRINPFLYLPSEIIENPAITIPELSNDLFQRLNSPEYYTIYPPIAQFVFWSAAWLSGGDLPRAILIMKSGIFLVEMGNIYLLWHLLGRYHLKKELTLLYILNPLVIIELTGNIHFEAVMIFGVLLSVYLLSKHKWLGSSLAFSLAIISKLNPILLLPFFLKRLKIKKSILFFTITISVSILAFIPFMSWELFHGLGSSIGLYFQKFEFNASIFYVVRTIGFWSVGYDVIQTAGILMGAVAFVLIILLTFFENADKQNLPGIFIWPLFIYFSLATIIHPWYITPLLAFCLFSQYRFPIVWSFFIFLSYSGYTQDGFQEQIWVLWLEYLIVFGVMFYEVFKYKDLLKPDARLHEFFK
jgi:hypothetical protein